MTTNEILEQAQIFASAWSLVGSRFDSGDGIDCANKEEERLGEMIDELVKERDTLRDAARMALDALENHEGNYKLNSVGCDRQNKAEEALKAVL